MRKRLLGRTSGLPSWTVGWAGAPLVTGHCSCLPSRRALHLPAAQGWGPFQPLPDSRSSHRAEASPGPGGSPRLLLPGQSGWDSQAPVQAQPISRFPAGPCRNAHPSLRVFSLGRGSSLETLPTSSPHLSLEDQSHQDRSQGGDSGLGKAPSSLPRTLWGPFPNLSWFPLPSPQATVSLGQISTARFSSALDNFY